MATVNPSDAGDKDVEASSEEFTKGLPKRGAWKIGLVVVLVIVGIGYVLLPDGGSNRLKPSTEPINSISLYTTPGKTPPKKS